MGYIVNAINAKAEAAPTADKLLADITRAQYDDFIKNFGGFEDNLIARSQTDNSLVDQAKLDAPKAAALATGVANRNASRYGIGLMPDQIAARDKALQLSGRIGSVDAINNAKFAQKDLNNNLLDSLIDIGNGVQSGAVNALGSSAQTAVARQNAYTQAKAASKANTYSTIGSLASAAIFAMAF